MGEALRASASANLGDSDARGHGDVQRRAAVRAHREHAKAVYGPRVRRWRLGAAAALGCFAARALVACSLPSASVDGGDLLGVFDASADHAASGDAGAKKQRDAGAAAAKPADDAGASVRAPVEGSCVAPGAAPNNDVAHTLGRPTCREAQVLEWRDPSGAPRYACVFAPKGFETRAPLPLVLFFHDELDDPTSVDKKTGLKKLLASFDLSGDPAHQGFVVLAVQGRHIFHGKRGAVFDADATAEGNADVATIDHFFGELDAKKLVDPRRVYTLGASYGGAMAATYAMLRADKIAAFAAFATDEPAAKWSCGGPPPPGMLIYRACDSVFACESVERFLRDRDDAHAETAWLRLGAGNDEEPSCAQKKKCSDERGTANHHRWPRERDAEILRFFARHALGVADRDGGT